VEESIVRTEHIAKVVALGTALALFMGACDPDVVPNAAGTAGLVTNDSTDCPGPYFKIKVPQPGETTIDQDTVALAEQISQVPEFHDCQRFIASNTYDKLFAVFASFRLESIDDTLNALNANLPPASTQWVAVAAAEIYTTEGTYDALGINPGFSCLYLANKNDWKDGYMLSTGWDEKKCVDVMDLGASPPAGTTMLKVRRIKYGALADADYPAVARWEVDAAGNYLIGIKCGDAWCQVGGTESGLATVTGTFTSTNAVDHVNGWFDQQLLALPGAAGAGATPSPIMGVARPVAGLGAMMDPVPFENGWVEVGGIQLSQASDVYVTKLGLGAGWNQLFLKGKKGEAVWHAKIVSAGGQTSYRKVLRHSHDGMGLDIPGTLRWRWVRDDETVWARCLEGCCQVQDQVDSPS
jgi:hypothetical protein